jgi:transposase-like protein
MDNADNKKRPELGQSEIIERIPLACSNELAAVEIRRRVVANVTGVTLKSAIRECVDENPRIMTDENQAYNGIGTHFAGGHESVCHSAGEYARGDVNTNTAESSFAILKRGLNGVYHAVNKQHLPLYLGEFDFRWNTRKSNDGQRTMAAINADTGKRLVYKSS